VAEHDLVAFGDVMVDEYYAIDELPGGARKQLASFCGCWAGGMAGNVAAVAAAEGLRCAVAASVGADAWGRALVDELSLHDVDVRWIRRRDEPTGRTVIGLLPDGERMLLVAPGAHAEPPLECLAEVIAARPRLIYTGALAAKAALRVAQAARAARIAAVADIEEHEARREPETARRLAGACDLVACSDGTARLLGPRPQGAVRLLLRGAAGLAVETDAGTWAGAPDPAAAAVDTTGGGDAAVAGACAGVLAGDGPEAIGERALRAAAAAVGRIGVRRRLEQGSTR
jgi:sugar/nucleoside kinase (ribokinase family)